jgi:fimbrial isopeptide formation D2 family protein
LAVKSDLGTAPGSAVGNCSKDVYVNNETCKNPNDHYACVVQNKRAGNITAGLTDANNSTAHAGDNIEYTLSATNTQKYTTYNKYVITDNIGDILEYADVVNLNGGKLDGKGNVSWPAKDIKAGQTIQATFTVKVKDPIPATPVSTSNPGSFDLTMTNSYGDTVKIHLPPTTSKIIEATSSTLPNTGPGTNIFIAVMLTSVIGYFFARSRLMSKELDIVKVEYTTGA